MGSILDICAGLKRQELPPGAVLLAEGETSGRLYVLAEGKVEVLRGDTQVAVVEEAGAVFGEMSVLLGRPHTATVRATSPVGVFVFDDAAASRAFLCFKPRLYFTYSLATAFATSTASAGAGSSKLIMTRRVFLTGATVKDQ